LSENLSLFVRVEYDQHPMVAVLVDRDEVYILLRTIDLTFFHSLPNIWISKEQLNRALKANLVVAKMVQVIGAFCDLRDHVCGETGHALRCISGFRHKF